MVDPVALARELIARPSPSRDSNAAVSDFLAAELARLGFEVERLSYREADGLEKVSLVARRGEGPGGLAFFSHSDTVPGDSWAREAFAPTVAGGRLIGLGACDMKGPLAATVAAAAAVDPARLRRPVFVAVAADEEVGGRGAQQIARESRLLPRERFPGVVAEPTRLEPVHAHKGIARVVATARGRAAHTSTDLGDAATFKLAPFIAEMAALAPELRASPDFRNDLFEPPTNGFNMVFEDGGCRPNVTAARASCTVGFRPMPGDRSRELVERILAAARRHGLETDLLHVDSFYLPPDAPVARAALEATGAAALRTVPFGTDALYLQARADLVVLGPGDIAQAHTVGEWIEVAELERAVGVYRRLIDRLCVEG